MPEHDIPRWFSQPALGECDAQHNFQRFLCPLAGQSDLHFVQVGVFTGDASVWLLENVLTHPSSTLDDVDTWEPVDYFGVNGADAERIHDECVAPYGDRVRKWKVRSWEFFANWQEFFVGLDGSADFIYIDADHFAVSVLEDAVCAWRQLKVGGIMAFDDYSDLGLEYAHPHVAIEAFLSVYRHQLEVLLRGLQVWVRRIA